MQRDLSVLVTGAYGFLGGVIARALECARDSDGAGTYDVARLGRGEGAEVRADLAEGAPDLSGLGSMNAVVHAAGLAHVPGRTAEQVRAYQQVNVAGTVNLLKALRGTGVRRLVFVSTTLVYGEGEGRELDEKAPLDGNGAYAASKIQAEGIVRAWCEKEGVECLVLRLPLVAGVGAKGNLSRMVEGIQRGRYVRIGAGEAQVSMVLAEDVARLVARWLRTGFEGAGIVGGAGVQERSRIYNLTDGRHPRYCEVDAAIARAFGRRVRAIPRWVGSVLGAVGSVVPGLPVDREAIRKLTTTRTFSDRKAREELGWEPSSVVAAMEAIALAQGGGRS